MVILHAYDRLMRGLSHDIVHLLIKLDDISLVDSSYSYSHVDNVRDCQSGQSPCCCAVRNAPSVYDPTPTTPETLHSPVRPCCRSHWEREVGLSWTVIRDEILRLRDQQNGGTF